MIDLITLIHQCAPNVAPSVLYATIRTESGFNPLALHINGAIRLQRPPKSAAEATAWSSWLIEHGYSVDLGLMQINSRNLASLGLTPMEAFDPCQNVRAGATLLAIGYARAARSQGAGTQALLQAISAYNTGDFHKGFNNGYVWKVVSGGAPGGSPGVTSEPERSLTRPARGRVNSDRPDQPYGAGTAVGGFGVAP
jgi:type IV secretion system protein VirB1